MFFVMRLGSRGTTHSLLQVPGVGDGDPPRFPGPARLLFVDLGPLVRAAVDNTCPHTPGLGRLAVPAHQMPSRKPLTLTLMLSEVRLGQQAWR